MPRCRCGECGREVRSELLRYCETCQMWVCVSCTAVLGIADVTVRCPRCYHVLAPEAPAAVS